MTEVKPDWVIFLEDLDRPMITLDERAEEIADILDSGKASSLFLAELSRAIRPSGKKQSFELKLEYIKKHEPKRIGWRIGLDMIAFVDDEGMTIDEAVYQVKIKWGEAGTSRSRCLECLKSARQFRAASELVDSFDSPEK